MPPAAAARVVAAKVQVQDSTEKGRFSPRGRRKRMSEEGVATTETRSCTTGSGSCEDHFNTTLG